MTGSSGGFSGTRGAKSMDMTSMIKKALLRTTGFNVESLGQMSFLITRRKDLWFSFDSIIRTIIESEGIDLIVDVGANEGQFGRKLRRYYSGNIISLEPVLSTYERLQRITCQDPNWQVLRVAAGSQEGSCEINVSSNSVFSSLLQPNNLCRDMFGDSSISTRRERVVIRRLDNLLTEVVPDLDKRRMFIKMDTQGYDLEVFKGLGSTIEQVAAIQSEVSLIPIYEGMSHWTNSIAAYEASGFSVVGMIPVNRDGIRVIEYDCFFTKRRTL